MNLSERKPLEGYFNSLDGLRAVSILLVMMNHLTCQLPPFFEFVRARGHLGVEVFFAVNKPNEITGETDKEARRSSPREGNSENKQSYEWSVPGDLQVRAMLLANNDKTLFVAGAKGDWITSQDAYEGRLGSALRIMSAGDGRTISEYELSSPPVFDGISAANGKLYMAMTDGSIQCLSKK